MAVTRSAWVITAGFFLIQIQVWINPKTVEYLPEEKQVNFLRSLKKDKADQWW